MMRRWEELRNVTDMTDISDMTDVIERYICVKLFAAWGKIVYETTQVCKMK